MNFNNVFVIHLTRFNTLEDFQKVLKFNDVEGIDANKLFEYKKNGYLKIFFDRKNSNPIAFTHNSDKKKIHFQENYLDFLKNMPSLAYESDYKKNLDVDTILEKISAQGIDSLSKFEKDFLDNLNK